MTITNGGTKTATDLVFKDILPEDTHIVSFKALDGGSCDSNTVICSLSDLTPGAIAQIKRVISNAQSNNLKRKRSLIILKTWANLREHEKLSL